MKYLFCFILTIFIFCLSARADDIEKYEIKQGERVQVEIDTIFTGHVFFLFPHQATNKIKIAGYISYDSSDYITLFKNKKDPVGHRIAKEKIKRVWISKGTKTTTINGGVSGAVFAAGLLVAIDGWPETRSQDNYEDYLHRDEGTTWKQLAGAALCGAAVGCIIGAHHRIDKWQEIEKNEFLSNIKLGLYLDKIRIMATINF